VRFAREKWQRSDVPSAFGGDPRVYATEGGPAAPGGSAGGHDSVSTEGLTLFAPTQRGPPNKIY
jgi:hypothetical protein